jgi:hypothetical protein
LPGLYSERFLLMRGQNVQAQYLVPPGKRAVVRCITVANLSLSQGNGALFVAERVCWFWLSPGEYGSVWADVRIVAYQGEFMHLSLEGPDVAGSVSGYLFDDLGEVAGFLPAPGAPPPAVEGIPLPPPPADA